MVRLIDLTARFWLLAAALLLTACAAGPTPPPPTAAPVLPPTPIPTLAVVVPTDPPLECGAEAAIALAQTQSDLALAAVGQVEAASQTAADSGGVARAGRSAFGQARELMNAYAVPDCLSQAKVFAVRFFEERVAAYDALGAGDPAGYETHLNDGEIARQNMISVVNGVLGQ